MLNSGQRIECVAKRLDNLDNTVNKFFTLQVPDNSLNASSI